MRKFFANFLLLVLVLTDVSVVPAFATVTYNVFPGSAWVTLTSYATVGLRRYNDTGPVKLYEVTSGGISGATGPTGTGSSITDGTVTWKYVASLDFTTNAALYSALPSTFTQPIIANYYKNNNTGTASTDQYSVSPGFQSAAWLALTGGTVPTTTSTNNLTIEAAPGEGIAGGASNALYADATKGLLVRNTSSGGSTQLIYTDIQDTVITGFQLVGVGANSYNNLIANGTGAGPARGLVINDDILDSASGGGSSSSPDTSYSIVQNGGNGSGTHIFNSLVIDRVASSSNITIALAIANNNASGSKVTNTTFYAPNSPTVGSAISTTYDGFTVTNCLLFGFGGQPILPNPGFSGTVTSSHNLTDRATSFGSGVTDTSSLFGKVAANQFTSVTSDFRLKSGADAIDAGATDTADIPAAVDFYGTSRPQGSAWDIGAHELISGGPPPSTPSSLLTLGVGG